MMYRLFESSKVFSYKFIIDRISSSMIYINIDNSEMNNEKIVFENSIGENLYIYFYI